MLERRGDELLLGSVFTTTCSTLEEKPAESNKTTSESAMRDCTNRMSESYLYISLSARKNKLQRFSAFRQSPQPVIIIINHHSKHAHARARIHHTRRRCNICSSSARARATHLESSQSKSSQRLISRRRRQRLYCIFISRTFIHRPE